MPTPSFSHLQRLEKEELILLRDLHGLNSANKLYLAVRFETATPDEIAKPFRGQRTSPGTT